MNFISKITIGGTGIFLVTGCTLIQPSPSISSTPPPLPPEIEQPEIMSSTSFSSSKEEEIIEEESSSSSSRVEEEPDHRPLEALPSTLNIPHFRTMRLQGTGLTLGDVLDRNDVYTRYAITYRSNGLLITGIMNIPEGAGPFPLVILNHGYLARSVYK